MATMVADDHPSRYRHLELIATPTLIIQGNKDGYTFSNQISILGVEGDHDFDFSETQIVKIKAAISAFI